MAKMYKLDFENARPPIKGSAKTPQEFLERYKQQLSHARIVGDNFVDLGKIDLSNGKLSFCVIHGSTMNEANLSNADFKGALLPAVCLHKATLFNTNFKKVGIVNAILSNTKIEGANFENAQAWGVNLKKAIVKKSNFLGVQFLSSRYPDFSARGNSATLAGAQFIETPLDITTILFSSPFHKLMQKTFDNGKGANILYAALNNIAQGLERMCGPQITNIEVTNLSGQFSTIDVQGTVFGEKCLEEIFKVPINGKNDKPLRNALGRMAKLRGAVIRGP